ncbi:uncharacterized protein [Hemitrygon akajei]|uniref:uncharacterized protein n=1 Tax=Hemitrygon akajei TaxID=2704970 RepID=UPI003BF96383
MSSLATCIHAKGLVIARATSKIVTNSYTARRLHTPNSDAGSQAPPHKTGSFDQQAAHRQVSGLVASVSPSARLRFQSRPLRRSVAAAGGRGAEKWRESAAAGTRFWSGGGTSPRPGSRLLATPLQVTVLAVWMILEMFRKGCRLADIRTRLGDLFPLEDPPQSSEATVADSQKVRGIEQQFRELVLYLLRDPSFRTSFLQVERGLGGCSVDGGIVLCAGNDGAAFPAGRGAESLRRGLHGRPGQAAVGAPAESREAQAPPRLQPCRADVELPVVGALSQLPTSCFQLLLSNMGSTHSLHPGTPLVLDPSPPGKGADSPEGGEVEAGGGVVDGHLPRPQMPCRRAPGKKMKSRRSLRGRRGRSALPPPSRRQYPRATKKENKESGCGCRSRLDVPESGDEPDTEVRGPEEEESCKKMEVVLDSEDEDSDLLTTCLRGKRPLRLYQRTKHNTLIPTLLEHLGPPAVPPLDGLPNPGVS